MEEKEENVLNVGYNSKKLRQLLFKIKSKKFRVKIYGDGNAGKRIAEILSKEK